MRPVERGNVPNSLDGNPLQFALYNEAYPYLRDRLGAYCSYCERHFSSGLEVEHISPKHLYAQLELSWSNFLLACRLCNASKRLSDVGPGCPNHLMPHIDNTLLAFDYLPSGEVLVSAMLGGHANVCAENTLRVVNLNRLFRKIGREKINDERRVARQDCYSKALHYLPVYQANRLPHIREAMLDLVVATGCWSVWYTVWKNDDELRTRLIALLPGIAQACFDADGWPIARLGGRA